MIEQAWDKMEALKPNVLSIFESPDDGHAGGARTGRHRRHLSIRRRVYPYTVKGAPIDMCYPREGTFAGINC